MSAEIFRHLLFRPLFGCCVFGLLWLCGCGSAQPAHTDLQAVQFAPRPKNIILLIGDGMAAAQVSALIYWLGPGNSIFEQFPVLGFHKSYSCNDLVTDSAAGATAFSCGQKTYNGTIGMLPPAALSCDQHRKVMPEQELVELDPVTLEPLAIVKTPEPIELPPFSPCPTVLEELDSWGWATGMVVACTATHATPASFIAHRELRAFTEDIALDYLHTSIDCFIGGGEALFNDRPDRRNLLDSLRQRDYVIRHGTSFGRLPLDGSRPFMLFTAEREPPTASGGRSYLPKATKTACHYLQKRSPKGFFLMVEGSQIDWACHANDRNWLQAEMTDFDRTVREAVQFAAENRETLVLVTGDHECGGLSLTQSDQKKSFTPKFSSKLHTGALVPVYAYGPGADAFLGTYENTRIYFKILEVLGLRR